MPEPQVTHQHLELVRADIKDRLEQDTRIRELEQQAAATNATLMGVQSELHAAREQRQSDKTELLQAIRENKPPSPWPAVSAAVGVIGLVLVIAAAIYGGSV